MEAHVAIDLEGISDHRPAGVGIAIQGDIGVGRIEITNEGGAPVNFNLLAVVFPVDDAVGRKARIIHRPLTVQLGVLRSPSGALTGCALRLLPQGLEKSRSLTRGMISLAQFTILTPPRN